MDKIKRFPFLAIAASLLFAATVIITKEALGDPSVDAVHFATVTAVTAALVSAVLLAPQYKSVIALNKKDWKYVLLLAILSGVIGYTLLRVGQKYTSAGNAGLLSSLTSVSTIIIAYFWLHEKLTKNVVRLLPILFISLGILLLDFNSLSVNLGDLLIIGFIVSVGVSNIIATKLVRKYNSGLITYGRLLIAGIILAPLLLIESTFSYWAILVGVLTVLFTYLFYLSLKKHGPQVTTLILSVYPPIVFLYGWIFLDEKMGFIKIIAALTVLVTAAYIGSLKNRVEKVSLTSSKQQRP